MYLGNRSQHRLRGYPNAEMYFMIYAQDGKR